MGAIVADRPIDEWLTDILSAAQMAPDDRVYFLCPFAKVINFAAQQNRALNLVYALEARGRLERDKPIAVVGAGLSGLTVVAALTTLGYTVHLFEKAGSILARQRNTLHRFVHPTINGWPSDQALLPTTHLPFFDWCTDTCKEVLANISREWARIVGNRMMKDRLVFNSEVASYDETRDFVFLDIPKKPCGEKFGALFLTMGFEDERLVANLKRSSYWDRDNYEAERDEDQEQRFLVSGTGDGGLIDALRLAHKDFKEGRLVLQLATLLAGSDLGRDIQKAEGKFAKAGRGAKREEDLEKAYVQAALNLPSAARELLEISRIQIPRLVWLVGEDETFVARDAAPIHKLMLADARENGVVKYIQGTISVDEYGVVTVETDDDAPPGEIKPIIRHGADNALDAFMVKKKKKADAFAALKARQRLLADDLIWPHWTPDIAVAPTGFPPYDPEDAAFREDRFPLAQKIGSVWPYLTVSKQLRGYGLQTTKPDAWYPTSLFGVPVTIKPRYPPIVPR